MSGGVYRDAGRRDPFAPHPEDPVAVCPHEEYVEGCAACFREAAAGAFDRVVGSRFLGATIRTMPSPRNARVIVGEMWHGQERVCAVVYGENGLVFPDDIWETIDRLRAEAEATVGRAEDTGCSVAEWQQVNRVLEQRLSWEGPE